MTPLTPEAIAQLVERLREPGSIVGRESISHDDDTIAGDLFAAASALSALQTHIVEDDAELVRLGEFIDKQASALSALAAERDELNERVAAAEAAEGDAQDELARLRSSLAAAEKVVEAARDVRLTYDKPSRSIGVLAEKVSVLAHALGALDTDKEPPK